MPTPPFWAATQLFTWLPLLITRPFPPLASVRKSSIRAREPAVPSSPALPQPLIEPLRIAMWIWLLIRIPLSDPPTPSMAKPARSSVTLSASILMPFLPDSPTVLLPRQYEPGWLITNTAVGSPGVLTLLTSIHVACAAQVKSDMRPIMTELIYDVFIMWFPFVLLLLVFQLSG